MSKKKCRVWLLSSLSLLIFNSVSAQNGEEITKPRIVNFIDANDILVVRTYHSFDEVVTDTVFGYKLNVNGLITDQIHFLHGTPAYYHYDYDQDGRRIRVSSYFKRSWGIITDSVMFSYAHCRILNFSKIGECERSVEEIESCQLSNSEQTSEIDLTVSYDCDTTLLVQEVCPNSWKVFRVIDRAGKKDTILFQSEESKFSHESKVSSATRWNILSNGKISDSLNEYYTYTQTSANLVKTIDSSFVIYNESKWLEHVMVTDTLKDSANQRIRVQVEAINFQGEKQKDGSYKINCWTIRENGRIISEIVEKDKGARHEFKYVYKRGLPLPLPKEINEGVVQYY